MPKFFLAACLILCPGAVIAQEPTEEIDQLFAASQAALQAISAKAASGQATPSQQPSEGSALSITQTGANVVNVVNSGRQLDMVEQSFGARREDDPSTPALDRDIYLLDPAIQNATNDIWGGSAELITQTATNAANVVYSDVDLGEIYQTFNGQQLASNSIEMPSLGSARALSSEQTGSNYANMMQGSTISIAGQFMQDNATQTVSNRLLAEGSVESATQSGTNVANIAMAEYAIGTAEQHIAKGVEQNVDNFVEIGAKANVPGTVTQSGINIGNVLVSDRIDTVTREFYGIQTVTNSVVLHGPDVPMISQTGSNIANLVVANYIGTVYQISMGSQDVVNTVKDGAGVPINSASIQQGEYNYEGASNVVNMMVLRAQRQSGASQQPVEVTQEANFPQTGQGVPGQSQTGNVVVINR